VKDMELKVEKVGDMIVYKCPICNKELLIKTSNYFPFINNCDHYKVYTLHLYDSIDCPKDKIEVRFIDNNGWKYIICKR
jgi:hypothetical protein